jgi:hypothetical protein
MAKRGNFPRPGHYKVQGSRVEESDGTRASKEALGREEARYERRVARKPRAATAPKQARKKAPPVAASEVLARAHDRELSREFERMNERRPQRRSRRAAAVEPDPSPPPRYLGQAARGMLQRAMRFALWPIGVARAVLERIRDHD